MSATAWISLGSNQGDRLQFLTDAVRRLEAEHTRLLRCSSIYETAPQGVVEQPAFLNLVVAVETSLAPLELLEHIQSVERSLGRIRKERWGPRTIDLDILLYGQERFTSPELELPHPRMGDRAFVLVPLLEIGPDQDLPTEGLREALERLPDQGIERFLDGDSFLRQVRGVQ